MHTPPAMIVKQSPSSQDELLTTIAQVLTSHCCNKLCVRELTVNSLFACRKFNSVGNVAQWKWITDKIHENSRIVSASKVPDTVF